MLAARLRASSTVLARRRPLGASNAVRSAASSSGGSANDGDTANIVLVGAGWWSQGWHLPQLARNEKVTISAIVDSSPHPKSNLNPHLEPLEALADRYGCPVFHSVSDLLRDDIGGTMDGAIVCTPHSTHYTIGKELIGEGTRRYEAAKASGDGGEYRPVNVLCEKPMTTSVREAEELHTLLEDRRDVQAKDGALPTINEHHIGGGMGAFLINHTANYRPQARAAHALIQSGKLGTIRHVSAFFASPLSWIFDDPGNTGWNEPDGSGEMLGNGFAWGQSSHLLGFIYFVTGSEHLTPSRVYCAMTHSEETGADVSHAATITCQNGATFSLSGTSLLPGNAHSETPVAKRIKIKIFGTKGALFYSGDDRDPSSGKLEWARSDDPHRVGAVEVQCPEHGFQFENCDPEGTGPEALQSFIDACLGQEYEVGADSLVGLRTVQTIDAMYRSHSSGNCENVRG
ncbi:hypothetical protein ACHAXT_001766 [Thalassiosira profunda]